MSTETIRNHIVSRDYPKFYWSTPGKTTTARRRIPQH
jgi:hypothetical protein